MVSMPSTGFYLFLRGKTSTDIYTNFCVNALNGLLLISSLRKVIMMTSTIKRVNALNGLLLISSGTNAYVEDNLVLCQCPQRASTYFFVGALVEYAEDIEVSMPSTGFYLFLQYPPRTLDFTEFWRGFLQVIN